VIIEAHKSSEAFEIKRLTVARVKISQGNEEARAYK